MADRPKNSDFNYANMDWDQYTAHRPPYPDKLYDMIYNYHESHNGGFDTALDVGAGIGIVTRVLLRKFTRVTLSDSSETYVSQARTVFASTTDAARLSFLSRKIEEMKPSDLPNGPVDLITAATCLHWADVLKVSPNAATLLKPGGTFSAWCYGGRPILPSSHPSAQEAVDRILERLIELYQIQINSPNAAGANMNARFNNLHFDPQEWEQVRRIQVMADVPMMVPSFSASEWRVLPDVESQEILDNDAFISRKANFEWVVAYIQSVFPPISLRDNLAPELEELKRAMGDGELEIKWPFCFVLATRK